MIRALAGRKRRPTETVAGDPALVRRNILAGSVGRATDSARIAVARQKAGTDLWWQSIGSLCWRAALAPNEGPAMNVRRRNRT